MKKQRKTVRTPKAAGKKFVPKVGVSVRDLMDFLNLTERRIGQLCAEGVLPKLARGRYDKDECAKAYIRYLQAQNKARQTENADGGATGVSDERRLLIRAQRMRLEQEVAEKTHSTIPIEVLEKECGDLVVLFRTAVLALSGRLAHLVPLEHREELRKELRSILESFARSGESPNPLAAFSAEVPLVPQVGTPISEVQHIS